MGVTVVIPCYNQGEYLSEAIESVLTQSVKCVIIVVNDGSTDNTEEVANSYGDKITYIYQENKGLSAARNTGIKHATTPYIVCLDADDKIDASFIEKALQRLSEGVGIVRTGYQEFGDSENKVLFNEEVTIGTLRKANSITSMTLFLKEAWEKVGGFDEEMKDGYEDWEFWLRIVESGYTVATVPEYLLFYRKHGRSMIDDTNAKAETVIEYIHKKHPPKGKILFLEDVIEKKMSGVTYYRMLVPAKALEDLGYEVRFGAELLSVNKDGENPHIIVDDLEWADVIVFPRYFNFSPNAVVSVMNICKDMGKRIIYETDDYLYLIPEHNPVAKFVNSPSSQMLIKFLEDSADQKTVTNRALQEILGGIICPNSIDMDMWKVENAKTDKLVIGWAGGWTHKKDLEMLIPVLKKLKEKYQFEIRLFGYNPEIPKHELYYKSLPWADVLNFPEKLAEAGFDIGIAPLVDDEFNQFKSNIKWLEYAMLGVPIVASKLPPYEDIEDGVTGFLATTEQEWYDKLEKLIVDAEYRKKIGQQAKEFVEHNYNIKSTICQWIKAYFE